MYHNLKLWVDKQVLTDLSNATRDVTRDQTLAKHFARSTRASKLKYYSRWLSHELHVLTNLIKYNRRADTFSSKADDGHACAILWVTKIIFISGLHSACNINVCTLHAYFMPACIWAGLEVDTVKTQSCFIVWAWPGLRGTMRVWNGKILLLWHCISHRNRKKIAIARTTSCLYHIWILACILFQWSCRGVARNQTPQAYWP